MATLLIRIFLILLLASPAYAGSVTVVVGQPTSISGCSASTNEVGDRTQESTSGSISLNYAWVFRSTADCSGTLEDAYIYHNDTNESSVKVCVYVSTNADLASDSSASLVGCSPAIAGGSSTGYKTGSIGSGGVTNGNYYWVAIFKQNGGNNWVTTRGAAAGKTLWSKSASGYYDSIPDPLPSTGWTANANYGDPSVYVQIGP